MPTSVRPVRAASLRAVARRLAPLALALAGWWAVAEAFPARTRFVTQAPQPGSRWFKGNTHAHTLNSDGDSPPGVVAQWYKAHGYQFLVLSDHNVFTDPATLAAVMDTGFLLVPGEEVTTSWQGAGRRAEVHVNALAVREVIPPVKDSTLLGTVQRTVTRIREAQAVPHLNHPNFVWSLDTATLAQLRGDRLIEIYNGHPTVHNTGGGGWPGMEEAWDHLLTGGKVIYGIAVDDAHYFQGEFAASRPNPGRGWVVVRAPRLETAALMTALEAGHFYASTGVVLEDVVGTDSTLAVRIAPQGNFKYTTTFIGDGGRVLATDASLTPTYRLTGRERYVRARVTDSMGKQAWVQPLFTTRYRSVP